MYNEEPQESPDYTQDAAILRTIFIRRDDYTYHVTQLAAVSVCEIQNCDKADCNCDKSKYKERKGHGGSKLQSVVLLINSIAFGFCRNDNISAIETLHFYDRQKIFCEGGVLCFCTQCTSGCAYGYPDNIFHKILR